MDSLWVLILLLVAFSTIVTVRLFRNGAREEAGTLEPPAPSKSTAGARRATSRTAAAPGADAVAAAPPATAAAKATPGPARARGRRAASKAAAAPAVWPGGDCPKCGSPTVPAAKFCGECGHRLVP